MFEPISIIRGDHQITARIAAKKDEPQIQQLIFDILEEYGLVPDPEGIDSDLFDVEKSYDGGFFGILELEGLVIGTFGLYKMSNEIVEIRKMYLNKNFRGFGLGRWMVAHMIDVSKIMGFSKIELETASPLVEAIALYRKLGFEEQFNENQTPRCDKSFLLKLQ